MISTALPVNTVTGNISYFSNNQQKNNQRATMTKSGWAHFDIYLRADSRH